MTVIYYVNPTTGLPTATTDTPDQVASELANNIVPTPVSDGSSSVVNTTNTSTVTATPTVSDWLSGTSFGISNMLLVGGVVVVGFFMLKGK